MKLKKLDLYYFFKDEHSMLYDGEGIGAVGLITPNQMINVENIDGENKKSGKIDCWSAGAHQHTREKVINSIYGIDYFEDVVYENGDSRRGLVSRMIEIRYVNNKYGKIIFITIPAFVNQYQYDCLSILNEQIKMVQDSCNVPIRVNVSNNGLNPNLCIIDSDAIFWDKKVNNLSDALEFYRDYIRDIDLSAFPENEIVLNLESKKHSM